MIKVWQYLSIQFITRILFCSFPAIEHDIFWISQVFSFSSENHFHAINIQAITRFQIGSNTLYLHRSSSITKCSILYPTCGIQHGYSMGKGISYLVVEIYLIASIPLRIAFYPGFSPSLQYSSVVILDLLAAVFFSYETIYLWSKLQSRQYHQAQSFH